MDAHDETTSSHQPETFNPWSIVNLVFHHLAEEGLHPVLGEAGDPGRPAADLLQALGITPAPEGNRRPRSRPNRISRRSAPRSTCLMLRAHDLGFRDVMQHTRTFGAVWPPE